MSDNIEDTPKGSCKRIISAKSQNIMMNSALAATGTRQPNRAFLSLASIILW